MILSLFLTFFFLCYAIFFHDRIRFYFFTKDLLKTELSGNSLSLHYSLAYPEKYGLHTKASLPIYHTDQKRDPLKTYQRLSRISKKKLSKAQEDTYDLLMKKVIQDIRCDSFPFYQEPFAANSGIQSSLPILLADYSFRRKQDVEDYLSLLDQIDDYFESLLLYEKEKADHGLFMSEYSANKVIRACQEIINKEQLKNGDHFLQLTFQDRIDDLVDLELLTQEECDAYYLENNRLLQQVVVPAYQNVADEFSGLKETADAKRLSHSDGLAHFPEGKEYYEFLLSSETGSDHPISELKRMLYANFQENYDALVTLLTKYPELKDPSKCASLEPSSEEPGKILVSLADIMQKDFPPFPSSSPSSFPFHKKEETSIPTVHVKQVPSSMEDYTSPAYYLTPPMDDMLNNVIYINHQSTETGLPLFTTLAHEGYPGHLYQTVYSQLYQKNTHAPLIRSFLHYGGFVEGYALYVENMSYEYATEQVISAASTKDTDLQTAYIEACRLNRNLHLCLYSLLDIAIHYDGASLKEVQKILGKAGVTNPAASKVIYQYIVEEPTNYPKYYLGYLEILELKKTAIKLYGDQFNLKDFHQFLLENGPADFDTLRGKLQKQVQEN